MFNTVRMLRFIRKKTADKSEQMAQRLKTMS
jgi:hypothetical protein